MVSALRSFSHKIEVSGDKLTIDVTDLIKENPTIITAVTSAGGQIREVTQIVPTLEDVLSANSEGTK